MENIIGQEWYDYLTYQRMVYFFLCTQIFESTLFVITPGCGAWVGRQGMWITHCFVYTKTTIMLFALRCKSLIPETITLQIGGWSTKSSQSSHPAQTQTHYQCACGRRICTSTSAISTCALPASALRRYCTASSTTSSRCGESKTLNVAKKKPFPTPKNNDENPNRICRNFHVRLKN